MIAMPIGHRLSATEMRSQVISSLVPVSQRLVAEAATASYGRGRDFPIVDKGKCIQAMDEAEVLHEMVFAAECSRRGLATLTCAVVVAVKVMLRWVKGAAICAMNSSSQRQHDGTAKRAAYPFLQVQVERLLVPRPIVLVFKSVATESAFEDAI
jgi:hypothetical protein